MRLEPKSPAADSESLWLVQPAGTENHSKAQKNSQASPCDAVEGCFRTAGAAEHGASTCGKASHPVTFRAVKQDKNDQQDPNGDPTPGENGIQHQTVSETGTGS